MRYSRSRRFAIPTVVVGLLASLAAAGCHDPASATAPDAHAAMSHGPAMRMVPITGEVQRQVAELRARTAAFHRFEAAAAAGWGTQITGCFANPALGGMGFHYGNVALIDGTVDVLEPELLLYEPERNGRLRLVAVEYIVPFTAWTGATPPELYGQSFHRNEGFGIWVLHVWHMRENPNGIFADWNPKVSCQFAP